MKISMRIMPEVIKESVKRGKLWYAIPSTTTSLRMKRIRSAGTYLEQAMERILKRHDIRYVKQLKLIGKPDFRINGTNILIFCDSSFWHGRRKREIDGTAFQKNQTFWMTKLLTNRARDRRRTNELRTEGWRVLRFWDTDILKRPGKVVMRLTQEIQRNG